MSVAVKKEKEKLNILMNGETVFISQIISLKTKMRIIYKTIDRTYNIIKYPTWIGTLILICIGVTQSL